MQPDIKPEDIIAVGRQFEADINELNRYPHLVANNMFDARQRKLVLDFPDTIEVSDNSGKAHTYSLTEILDGLTRMARNGKKRDRRKENK